jgi:uncharacterized membrane protein
MDLNDDIFEGLEEDTERGECEITYTNVAPEENTECGECEITYTNAEPAEPAAPEEPEKKEHKWALRDRLRSRALWAALAGLLVTVLSAFDIWDAIGITAPQLQGILTAMGAVLAAFGVFNDPTERDRF